MRCDAYITSRGRIISIVKWFKVDIPIEITSTTDVNFMFRKKINIPIIAGAIPFLSGTRLSANSFATEERLLLSLNLVFYLVYIYFILKHF